jgi:hypothetical protein
MATIFYKDSDCCRRVANGKAVFHNFAVWLNFWVIANVLLKQTMQGGYACLLQTEFYIRNYTANFGD